MRSGLAIPLACAALVLAAGCGSSSSSTSRTPTGSGAPAAPTTATATGGLKVTTTPKFAAPPASSPVQSGVVQIAYRNITIAPDTVKVRVGSTIAWRNYDPVEHNVTSERGPARFASKSFGEGEGFRLRVTKPGLIRYVCTIHPASMNGTIEVVR